MVTLLVLVQSFGVRVPIGLPFLNPSIFRRVFFMRSAGCIIELSVVSMTGRHNLSIFKEAGYESLIQSDVS